MKRRIRVCNRITNRWQGPLTLDSSMKSPESRSTSRKKLAITIACLFAMVVIAGCATTKITNHELLESKRLPPPAHIWVYNFAATPADLPADSALAGQVSEGSTPQTAEEIETGRRLGAEIAAQLVEEIRGMGLPAERGSTRTKPRINDIVIRGYLLSIDEGSATKRVSIGFGSGGSELSTAVEGYHMTAQGLRRLGSGTVEAGGGKAPGGAMGVATLIVAGNPLGLIVGGGIKLYEEVSGRSKIEGRAKQTAKEIADVLKKRFQEQGWIK